MNEALLLPLDEALASGGDSRFVIRSDGLNKYGTAAQPRAALPLGSCTSSSPSTRGFKAAARMQRLLRQARDPQAAAQDACESIRRRLRRLLNVPSGVDIALAPSGTDAELIAVALAGATSGRRITNIVVGPNEVGSGTPQAASARHYDCLVPSGRTVNADDPVDEPLAERIDLRVVPLRGDDGVMLDEEQLDERVVDLVQQAKAQRAIVLLHIVAHSKTGMHAPSLRCVAELRRQYSDLVVLVDAAQGRFSRKGMVQALEDQYLFLITGSKFFGGPPFSGALLIPESMSPQARGLQSFPRGFGDYFSAVEMPTHWRSLRATLPKQPNYAVILRWAAAMAEMDAYYATEGTARLRLLRHFERVVPEVFGASDTIELLAVYPPVYGEDRLLQSKTTVFSFRIRSRDGRFLSKDELQSLHEDLNKDVSDMYPAYSPAILSEMFHLGQPVAIGADGCALRVALGSELIVRVTGDPHLGTTLDERLRWLRDQLVCLRKKIEWVAEAQHAAVELEVS